MKMSWEDIRISSIRREKPGIVLLCIALWSLLSYTVISRYVIESAQVVGASMAPTLQDGNRYLLIHFVPMVRDLQRGEIIALHAPREDTFYVKRVIGLPGDRIRIDSGRVLVNEKPLREPYLPAGTVTFAGNLGENVQLVERGHYFVLGDNRSASEDSRTFGPISKRQVTGVIADWRAVAWFASDERQMSGKAVADH